MIISVPPCKRQWALHALLSFPVSLSISFRRYALRVPVILSTVLFSVFILKQVLVVYLTKVEVSELTISVVCPVRVLLGLLRVKLGVHIGVLLGVQARFYSSSRMP